MNLGYNAFRFEPGKDNLFSMRDDDAHMKLRNKMAAGVSPCLVLFTVDVCSVAACNAGSKQSYSTRVRRTKHWNELLMSILQSSSS
jgi:hypothetical protein